MLALLAAGALALLAATRPWLRATVESPGLPSDVVTVGGRDAAPAAFGLALVVIAAALAVIATKGWVRRGVGALVVVTSLAGAALAQQADPSIGPFRRVLADSPAFTGSNYPVGTFTAWQLVTVVTFLAAAVLGAVVVALAGKWPTMGSRFDAPVAQKDEPRTEGDLWAAMDEGRDPTE
ncbi:Trp biosynthesis-associated membrane protein [Aeromicrobium sp.]|uniref:Trp biosynthesis-associated membrane protein n=1 Tax=Aeromicrobium sp. TaxID=1871063 RepID=UPI003D6B873D